MSDALKILIVEDESIVAIDISLRLQQAGYEVVEVADNSNDAIEIFKNTTPDLVLMDINIKGELDGIETAKRIKAIQDIPLIFLTAFSQNEYLNRAKEVNPSAYLVKPFQPESLMTSIEIAIHNFAIFSSKNPSKTDLQNKEQIGQKGPLLFYNNVFFVKNNYKFSKIAIADLLFVESDSNYIKLVTTKEKILVRISLQNFMEIIQHDHIVRVHRGFAINIQNIDGFNDEEITIAKHQIPVGKLYKNDFLRSFSYL